MKIKTGIMLLSAVLGATQPAQAELIKDGVWKIQAGDTLDSVLENVLPNEPQRHQRLKQLALRLNKKAFDEKGQLVAGQLLRLPGARMPATAKADSGKIGKVVVTRGTTVAKSDDGKARRLERGDAVYQGDTIETDNASTQIRFSDGSLVALRPRTSFKVEEYNYSGKQDGSERGVYNLLKGGFRTISGAIGKLNKANYSVRTPVATIGIRGTHYGLNLCDSGSCPGQEDGLYGGVVDGAVVAQNNSGEHAFNNDEYFYIESIGAIPKSLLAPPGHIFGQDHANGNGEEQKGEGEQGDEEAEVKGNPLADRLDKEQQEDAITRENITFAIQNDLGSIKDVLKIVPLAGTPAAGGVTANYSYGMSFSPVADRLTHVNDFPSYLSIHRSLYTDSGVLTGVSKSFESQVCDSRENCGPGIVTNSILIDPSKGKPTRVGANSDYKVSWGRWSKEQVLITEVGYSFDNPDNPAFVSKDVSKVDLYYTLAGSNQLYTSKAVQSYVDNNMLGVDGTITLNYSGGPGASTSSGAEFASADMSGSMSITLNSGAGLPTLTSYSISGANQQNFSLSMTSTGGVDLQSAMDSGISLTGAINGNGAFGDASLTMVHNGGTGLGAASSFSAYASSSDETLSGAAFFDSNSVGEISLP